MKKYNNKYQVTINTIIFIFLVLSPIIDNITGIFLMAGRSTNLSSILKATVLFLCLIQIVVNGHSNVKELIYVIEGSGTLNFENEKIEFSEGDSILIEPNEKYYYDTKYCKISMSCSPAWSIEQHKLVK